MFFIFAKELSRVAGTGWWVKMAK